MFSNVVMNLGIEKRKGTDRFSENRDYARIVLICAAGRIQSESDEKDKIRTTFGYSGHNLRS